MKKIDYFQSALLFFLAGFSTFFVPNNFQLLTMVIKGFCVCFFALSLLFFVYLIVNIYRQKSISQNK